MSIRTGKLTVFFEEPFWVGIFERVENGKLSVSKVTFGTEPKDRSEEQTSELQSHHDLV